MIPPILQQARQFIAKGVDWSVVAARAVDAAAAGARASRIPMAVLLGHPDRLRPALGRPRVRRDAGLRRQPLPAAPAGGLRRAGRHGGHGLRDHRRAAGREPDVPGNHASGRRRRASKATSSRACSSRTFPTVSSTSATCRRRRLARRVPRRHRRKPGETTVYFAREGRILVDREKQMVQLELTQGTQHTTLRRAARRLRRRRSSSSFILNARPEDGVPAAARQGRAGDDDRRAAREIAQADARNGQLPATARGS